MEADDVMFALALHEASKGEEVTVISTDKDMIQLKNHYDSIDVYNPIQKSFYKACPNIVMEKAICGDASDGIPGLYRVGPKTLEKMLLDKALWNKKMEGNKEIYEAFTKIIDLSKFPAEKHAEAIKVYDETEYNKFEPNKVELFYFQNKMQDHIMRWGDEAAEITDELLVNNIDAQSEKYINDDVSDESSVETDIDDVLSEFI